ncbi:MAG: hypothetical protein IH825_08470, partial [Candidatus Marinimicrobia bacterium]|nr:hypothetical protein [Candidatus Neomarinimicrobiota bacterium]
MGIVFYYDGIGRLRPYNTAGYYQEGKVAAHTYHKIWLHFIWSTKDRAALISKELRIKLIKHMKE